MELMKTSNINIFCIIYIKVYPHCFQCIFAGGLCRTYKNIPFRPSTAPTPHTHIPPPATYTHYISWPRVSECLLLLTCSLVVSFVSFGLVWFRFMTCFHVTKFDFVSQTTRQPQSSYNGIMAIKLAFCLDTLPSIPLQW